MKLTASKPIRLSGQPQAGTTSLQACPATTLAVLGFPAPTRIPCGLTQGHPGDHRYTITWGDES